MNIIVSCSDIGEGPGTGGKGLDGGRERGGFELGPGVGKTPDRDAASGELGMCDGGTGKDESNRGRGSCLSARRDSVMVVADMVEGEGRERELVDFVRRYAIAKILITYPNDIDLQRASR